FSSLIFLRFLMRRHPRSPLFPYTTLFRSGVVIHALHRPPGGAVVGRAAEEDVGVAGAVVAPHGVQVAVELAVCGHGPEGVIPERDRKSTRLNSSHLGISYAVFCLKKKNKT